MGDILPGMIFIDSTVLKSLSASTGRFLEISRLETIRIMDGPNETTFH
jgi:hypothetical protein